MTLRTGLFAVVCALAVAAPALGDSYNKTVFTSSPITVKAGQEFLIALASNPTTGYSWTAASNNKNVTVWGSAYQAVSGSSKPIVGAGGQQVFVAAANKPGTATITFAYARPWQKGVKAARTMTFAVTVTR